MLVGDGADELKADGKTCGSETARDGDGWDAGEIGRPIWAEHQCAGGIILVAEVDGFLADERRNDRSCWDRQSVNACVFQCQMELLDEFFAKLESGEIDGRGDFSSHFQARAHVFAVIGGAIGKPSGLLMIVSSLGPGDLVSGVFGFF